MSRIDEVRRAAQRWRESQKELRRLTPQRVWEIRAGLEVTAGLLFNQTTEESQPYFYIGGGIRGGPFELSRADIDRIGEMRRVFDSWLAGEIDSLPESVA